MQDVRGALLACLEPFEHVPAQIDHRQPPPLARLHGAPAAGQALKADDAAGMNIDLQRISQAWIA